MINTPEQQLRKNPRLMSRTPFGRTSAVATSGNNFGTGGALAVGLTQRQKIALAGHFKAVRIAIPNLHTSSISGVLAALCGIWRSA